MDEHNRAKQLEQAEEGLRAATKALEAAQAARAAEADRIAAARREFDELGKQLQRVNPETKEFRDLLMMRQMCRERQEVYEARLTAAQGAVDEAEAAHAVALDVLDREKLKDLEHEIAAAEERILDWFSREVSRPFAEKMALLAALVEEARLLDLALGKRAGRGPGLPLVGAARVRWLTPDANPFSATAASRLAKAAEARRRAALQGEVERNYVEAVELHARLAAEEAQRQRARERTRYCAEPSVSGATGRGMIVSDIALETGGDK